MKTDLFRRFYVLLPVILILMFFIKPIIIYAAGTHVYDDGGFFTEDEIEFLERELSNYEINIGADIIIITANNLKYNQEAGYLDDYSDKLYFNDLISSNSIIMLYGEDRSAGEGGQRYCYIHGYGSTEKYMSEKRINKIIDGLVPLFKSKEYEKAGIYFAEKAAAYMNLHPAKDLIFTKFWFQIIISAVIGAIAVGCMAASSGGKVTTNNTTYFDSSHSGITARRDQYIRTSVTKRKIPQQSSGSGGRSGGGRSRSSGGRRF